MSDTAEQPWWADVQHLRPREAGGSKPARFADAETAPVQPEAAVAVAVEAPSTGRFTRTSVVDSPLETAVAVAITDDLPRLQDIAWHDFIDSHQELDDVVGGDLWEEPSREAKPKRRTVEISGRVDRAATAPVEVEIPVSRRHREPVPDAGVAWDEPVRTPGRRTVEIRGQVDRAATAPVDEQAAAYATRTPRRTPPTAAERFHARPDRVALWAFLLGVVLMIVAALSAPEADAAVRLIGG